MFGVSYQVYGSSGETGMRPLAASWARKRQWAKFGNEMMLLRPTRFISRSTSAGWWTA